MRHHRPIRAVVVIASLCTVVATPAALGQPAAEPPVATFHDPGAFGFSNQHVDCTDSSWASPCAFAFDGTTEESGYLSGSTTYHGLLYGGDAADHAFRWQVTEVFTGSVAGCGRGSMQWTGSGYGDITTFDPASQSARLWGTLTITPGSGTRGLHGVTGTLAVEARASAFPPGAQDGTMTGPLSCNPHH